MILTLEPASQIPPKKVLRVDIETFRAEIDQYYEEMTTFAGMDPGVILMTISGYTARASQIRSHIVRDENKPLQLFRTREIDPFLTECDRQFKIWSRLISTRQLEWETSRGI